MLFAAVVAIGLLITCSSFHVRYVVVGAGPGGLQIAHYLESAKRDYVVIEKNAFPGSFFEKYPRFRQLISINKRSSGRRELDHSMRHDWNSLLSDPSHRSRGTLWPLSSTDPSLTLDSAHNSGWLLFRNFSNSYYPHADDLVRYLRAWALRAGTGSTLRVQYNVTVVSVTPLNHSTHSTQGGRQSRLSPRFHLSLSNGSSLKCTFLIFATGLQVRL